VKWVAERSEAFLTDAHGRDHVTHAEMAFDAEGKITGLRVKTIANLGAYMSTFSSSVPTYLYGTLLSGQYEIAAIYCEVDAVYTNTVPVDAYRGAGYAEVATDVQRLWLEGRRDDAAARVPDELVLKTNLLGTTAMVRERLALYRRAGITTIRVEPAGDTLDARLANLGRLLELARTI